MKSLHAVNSYQSKKGVKMNIKKSDVKKNIKIQPIDVEPVEPVATKNSREVFAQNPFLSFTVTANKRQMTVSKGSVITSDDEENPEEFQTTIAQIKLVDSEQFIKLYTGQIANIFELSPAGIKLFGLLLVEVQKKIGGESVYLTYKVIEALAKQNGKTISQSTYSRGIKDLIEAKIIADNILGAGWFYINPALLFNGDRARFVTEYRKKEEPKIKVNKNQASLNFTSEE